MTMPSGKYYIGDLCYVLHEDWEEVVSMLTISSVGEKYTRIAQGEFVLRDGRKFATYVTKYGDGEYTDDFGRTYGVDTGMIGCILVDDIDFSDLHNGLEGGQEHHFGTDFESGYRTGEKDGVIFFGDVEIDTNPERLDDDGDGCG